VRGAELSIVNVPQGFPTFGFEYTLNSAYRLVSNEILKGCKQLTYASFWMRVADQKGIVRGSKGSDY